MTKKLISLIGLAEEHFGSRELTRYEEAIMKHRLNTLDAWAYLCEKVQQEDCYKRIDEVLNQYMKDRGIRHGD